MAFNGPLEDRILIRERYGAYSDAVFQSDVEAYLACFIEDCLRVGGGAEVRGKHALREHWEGSWTMLEKMTFFTEVSAIEVHGDRATGRCYCREILLLKGGGIRKVVGCYNDELARVDGGWLFVRREYQLFLDEGTRPTI